MVRPLADADAPRALAIAREGVGPGWAEPDDLRPGPHRRVVVAEDEHGVVVGVASAGLRAATGFLERGHPVVRTSLGSAGVRAGGTLALLDLAAVVPAARGRGHYRDLLEDRLAWAGRSGASHALAFGWTPPDGCHIAPAMARAGFARLAEIPRFFHEASLGNGALCPACGSPCLCSAVVFVRPIGRGREVQLDLPHESPA